MIASPQHRLRAARLLALIMAALPAGSGCSNDGTQTLAPPASDGGNDAAVDGDAPTQPDAPSDSGWDTADADGPVGTDAQSEAGPEGGFEDAPTGAEVKYVLGAGRADFAFELQDLGIGYHTGKALDEAIAMYGLADVIGRLEVENALTHTVSLHRVDSEGFPVPMVGEWDYSCIHLSGSEIDGAGLPRSGFPCFDSLQGCDDPPHAGVAYDRAWAYHGARRDHEYAAYPTAKGFIDHTGHYLFPHYSASWGGNLVVSELGENINSVQAHIAFLRGASRQFGVPWGTDFSPWFGDGMLDYWQGADRVWYRTDANGNITDYYSGSDHGHSLSLNERIWYLSFLGGASYLLQEGASVNFFAAKQAPTALSPLGQLAQSFQTFVTNHPDRGTPYVPIAVVVDFYHGLGLGTWNRPAGQEVSWNHFPLDATQQSTLGLLDALWPGSFRVSSASEANYIVNGPVGDTVDVLADLDNQATLSLLSSYSVVFMSGAVHWTTQWKSAVWNGFLAQGGSLILDVNPTHDAIFADLGAPALSPFVPGYAADQIGAADVLSGRVVRVASPVHYPALLAELGRRVLPFGVTGTGFALNRKASGSWLVTLVNNSGVDKQPRTPTVISGGPVTASLTPPAGQQLVQVTALHSAHTPSWSAAGLQVPVDPGGVTVLEVEVAAGP